MGTGPLQSKMFFRLAWTRTLIEALKAEGVEGATLLDIGGGIGVIQHELLAAGAASAISVDASSAYLDAAREESDRRGLRGRVTYRHGDFVELAESVPPADIVTLERVLNVYPDWVRLAGVSAIWSSTSSGNFGFSCCHIHTASSSLVGLTRPSSSLSTR